MTGRHPRAPLGDRWPNSGDGECDSSGGGDRASKLIFMLSLPLGGGLVAIVGDMDCITGDVGGGDATGACDCTWWRGDVTRSDCSGCDSESGHSESEFSDDELSDEVASSSSSFLFSSSSSALVPDVRLGVFPARVVSECILSTVVENRSGDGARSDDDGGVASVWWGIRGGGDTRPGPDNTAAWFAPTCCGCDLREVTDCPRWSPSRSIWSPFDDEDEDEEDENTVRLASDPRRPDDPISSRFWSADDPDVHEESRLAPDLVVVADPVSLGRCTPGLSLSLSSSSRILDSDTVSREGDAILLVHVWRITINRFALVHAVLMFTMLLVFLPPFTRLLALYNI